MVVTVIVPPVLKQFLLEEEEIGKDLPTKCVCDGVYPPTRVVPKEVLEVDLQPGDVPWTTTSWLSWEYRTT
jgi:hypothetical protein